MPCIQTFATRIKAFDRQTVCLIVQLFPSKRLSACFSMGLSQIAAMCSWSLDRPTKGALNCLIQFWARLQTLQNGTYKWLPLIRLRSQNSSRFCGVTMTKGSLLSRLSVHPHLISHCKPITSLGPRPKTNPSADRFHTGSGIHTCRMRSGDETSLLVEPRNEFGCRTCSPVRIVGCLLLPEQKLQAAY